jgi:hypothetical protein
LTTRPTMTCLSEHYEPNYRNAYHLYVVVLTCPFLLLEMRLQSMRLGLLEPLTTIDDKIAVRYAKLSVSTTHLLPEKLQMLQKVKSVH